MSVTRLLTVDDAAVLAELVTENREFLQPWDPAHEEEYFTEAFQRDALLHTLAAHAAGTMMPLAILDEDGSLAGRLNINGITRGAFQSAAIGYWVAEKRNGRGIATRAVSEAKDLAFGGLGLHRLQAETLLHNSASQTVLRRNGFLPYGIAPQYLKIAGTWQDHVLYQVVHQGAGSP
jgi:ribosomal-protein-alanine N-acetyltransferase